MAENKTVTCRWCGREVFGYWEYNRESRKSQLFNSDGIPHHLYEGGVAKGCQGRAFDEPAPANMGGIPLSPSTLNPQMDANTMQKVEQAITASQAAFNIALDITKIANEQNVKVEAVEAVVKALDSKWTNIAESMRVVEIHMNMGGGETKTYKMDGRHHEKQEVLLRLLAAKKSIWILGPAGSGKTMGVAQACGIMEKKLYVKSMGPLVGADDLFGFLNMATGEYVETDLFKAVTEGAVFLADEIDRGNPGLNTQYNIIAEQNNRTVGFPHGQFVKDDEFCFVCTANTFGGGADPVYIGANQQDGAFMNRFTTIRWDYDWDFVHSLSSNSKWVEYIKALYESAQSFRLPVVIGPRDAIDGADLIDNLGFSWSEAADMKVWTRISTDMRRQIETKVELRHYIG